MAVDRAKKSIMSHDDETFAWDICNKYNSSHSSLAWMASLPDPSIPGPSSSVKEKTFGLGEVIELLLVLMLLWLLVDE